MLIRPNACIHTCFLLRKQRQTCEDSFSAVWAATTSIKDAKCTELRPLHPGHTKPRVSWRKRHSLKRTKKSRRAPLKPRNPPCTPYTTPLLLGKQEELHLHLLHPHLGYRYWALVQVVHLLETFSELFEFLSEVPISPSYDRNKFSFGFLKGKNAKNRDFVKNI